MRSRAAGTALVLALLMLVGAPPAGAAQAPPPAPKAWILVDADTGVVLSAQGARTPQPPASTIKLLTALVASEQLSPAEAIPISATAAGMPARKINVKEGQSWTYDSLLHSIKMVSANDAAVAIAEKLGDGSLDGWSKLAHGTADRLGLADRPVLNDPAGLDDEFSYKGGTLISPRSLSIGSRA